jgi:2-oxoglutarate ferredoxin oxidoreductase subunit beta
MKPKIKVRMPAGVKSRAEGINKNIASPKISFASDQEIRWCPGCGDYSILKQVQSVLAEENIPKEDIVFISGIGCSSRFPYYMDTFGMHSIHGRATAIASGLRAVRKDLNIWVVTGDGDGLSIGGNHLIHLLRRNFNLNILLFNNEIYGLTKGQYSPTSPLGTVNKTAVWGTIDLPFNPLKLALGAEATFIARGLDIDPVLLRMILKRANQHKGTSLVEIYQNCNVFNDGAFSVLTDKAIRKDHTIILDHNKPLIFGQNDDKGIILDGFKPIIVSLEEVSQNDLWIHDEQDGLKATLLTRFFDNPENNGFPRPLGVFYSIQRPVYEDLLNDQKNLAIEQLGKGNPYDLFKGKNFWEVK